MTARDDQRFACQGFQRDKLTFILRERMLGGDNGNMEFYTIGLGPMMQTAQESGGADLLNDMLSAAYEPSSDLEAIQFPGWRGQKDWESISSFTNYEKDSKSNLAIRGLFKHLDSTPEGYTKVDWGATLVKDDNMESFYSDEIFSGWDYKSAPIYLLPFTRNDCIGGSVTNGYGFMKY